MRNAEQLEGLYSKLKNKLGLSESQVLENGEIFEILMTSKSNIFLDQKRVWLRNSGEKLSPDKTFAALGTIAAMNGLGIKTKSPSLSRDLPPDEFRVQGTIPPLSPSASSRSMRTISKGRFAADT